MAGLSKLTSSVPYNCYEIAHPWNTSCSQAWFYLFQSCVKESAKIYSILYLFAQLGLSRRVSVKAFQETFKSTVRSTLFLSYNVFYFLFFICVFRRILGRLYLHQSTFCSGVLGSFLAILIERPSRRKVLALYMLNIASEVAFNFLACRGMVPVIPKGDVYMFAIGLAGHLYLMNETSSRGDPISKVLEYLIGKKEFIKASSPGCHHQPSSCILYSLQGFGKPFAIGYLARCALSIATNIPRIVRSPSLLADVVTNKAYIMQGVFLGGAIASFRLVKCLLRGRDLDEAACRAIGGACAGLWIGASRNTSLSLYVFWKSVESYYMIGMAKGKLPNVPYGAELVYAFSCGFMLFSAILEPHNIRGSYINFLNNITGTALARVNRHPIEVLGFHSTIKFGEYFPYDMDLTKVSKNFMEQVIVWS